MFNIVKTFKYKDRECAIVKIDSLLTCGYLCGYVGLNEDDLNHNVDYEERIDCHGGITFLSNDNESERGIYESKVAIGFDCAHYEDRNNLKCEDFVENELKSIVDQLEDMA